MDDKDLTDEERQVYSFAMVSILSTARHCSKCGEDLGDDDGLSLGDVIDHVDGRTGEFEEWRDTMAILKKGG